MTVVAYLKLAVYFTSLGEVILRLCGNDGRSTDGHLLGDNLDPMT